VPIVFFVGCVVQVISVLTTSDAASRGDPNVLALPRLYIVNVVGETFFGHRLVDSVWLDVGLWLFIVLAVAVTAAIVFLWIRCDAPGRLWGSVALAMSVVLYGSTVFWRGVDQVELHDGVQTGSGARYTGLGLQLLVAAFVIFVDRARFSERVRQVVVALVVVQAVLIPIVGFRLLTLRSLGPSWENSLAGARLQCEEPGRTETFVVITPAGWSVRASCTDLR
jgi:hypothetical protein